MILKNLMSTTIRLYNCIKTKLIYFLFLKLVLYVFWSEFHCNFVIDELINFIFYQYETRPAVRKNFRRLKKKLAYLIIEIGCVSIKLNNINNKLSSKTPGTDNAFPVNNDHKNSFSSGFIQFEQFNCHHIDLYIKIKFDK